MSIPVSVAEGPYAAALAELPLSAHRSPERSGSLVVLSGRDGWTARLSTAVAEGARGILVGNPHVGDADDVDSVIAAHPGLSVVVDRPLLRSDLVADVLRDGRLAPNLVQVECSGSSADFAAVARDALGWARVLAGGPLELSSSRSTPRGFSALMSCSVDDHSPHLLITVLATRRAGTAPWIRATALGPERVEVTIDAARRSAIVERSSESGRDIHPIRWEAAERVALRRALSEGSETSELAELLLDTRLAARADGADSVE